MPIDHTTHVNGNAQCLAYADQTGQKIAVWVVEAGTHNFGVTQTTIELHVIQGEIRTKKGTFRGGSIMPLRFTAGETLSFYTEVITIYVCRYSL